MLTLAITVIHRSRYSRITNSVSVGLPLQFHTTYISDYSMYT